eukprot:7596715-Alexandrium_andersonii.AAC.1
MHALSIVQARSAGPGVLLPHAPCQYSDKGLSCVFLVSPELGVELGCRRRADHALARLVLSLIHI